MLSKNNLLALSFFVLATHQIDTAQHNRNNKVSLCAISALAGTALLASFQSPSLPNPTYQSCVETVIGPSGNVIEYKPVKNEDCFHPCTGMLNQQTYTLLAQPPAVIISDR